MPYRRLPNTDQARLRALKTACNIAEQSNNVVDLPFSAKISLEIKSFTPIFEQTVNQYSNCKNLQAEIGKNVNETAKNARMYLSHFIQVFNMCILRGEIKNDARKLLGLDECGTSLPDLTTDQQLLDWGTKIISGEEKRSGNRIYNPSIAVVKVKMSLFKDNFIKHRDILQTIQKHHAKLNEIRQKADEIILELWNEIESKYNPNEDENNRQKCIDCGIVYFYRPHERQKKFLMGLK